MDPANDQTQQSQQPTVTPQPAASPFQPEVLSFPPPDQGSVPPRKTFRISRKLIALVSLVIVLLIVLLALSAAQHSSGKYAFSLNNDHISQAQFQEAYDYYKSQNAKNFDRQYALNFVKGVFVQNYLLKQESIKENLNQTDLNRATDTISQTFGNSNMPESLRAVLIENAAIKQLILAKIVTKTRSGDILVLYNTVPIDTNHIMSVADFMKTQLTKYKNELDSGASYDSVKTAFLADQDVGKQPAIAARSMSFDNMAPGLPLVTTKSFINNVFATGLYKTTPVIDLSARKTDVSYGVAFITAANDGQYTSYQDWLNKQMKSVTINSDFSGVQ